MKTKITLFHLFVVLTVLLSIAVAIWAVVAVQKLSVLSDEMSKRSVEEQVSGTATLTPKVIDADFGAESSVDMSGVNFDFTPYNNTNAVADVKSGLNGVDLPSAIVNSVVWTEPKKINKLGFFGATVDKGITLADGTNYISTDYYLGGYFNVDNKQGAIVYSDISCIDEMGCVSEPISMFVLYDGKVVLISKNQVKINDNLWGSLFLDLTNYVDRSWVSVDNNLTFAYLNYPAEITNESGWKFKYSGVQMNGGLFKFNFYKKIYTDLVWGDFYMTNDARPKVVSLGKDLRIRSYSYTPGIVDKNGFIDVVYDDSGETMPAYRFTNFGGCGEPTINIIPEGKEDVAGDLEIVGKTTTGIYVYGLKDKNHRLLKNFYNGIFYPGAEGNISYDDFIAARPAVFWRDNFGQLIMFQLNKFMPTAECGKPVIYLYPEKTTKVKVQLQLSKLTVSEPTYGDGWEVVAEPNGQLTETKSGTKYPYLFWEGNGVGNAVSTDAGFNVKKENVEKFLDDKLAMQGLNKKEIADFKEFWLPRMQSAPYYFVTFYGTPDMNLIAPLHISPRPDTLIRVLMDYRAVSAPLDRPEQKLTALPRKGFTVIEWGGVLYR